MALYAALFLAGVLTILLPCILPLVPIVLGVSIAGRSKWRPLLIVLGMAVSFVVLTFLLLTILNRFVEAADLIRIGTYDLLLLFGVGFLTESRTFRSFAAVLGSFFFLSKGFPIVFGAAVIGIVLIDIAGRIAPKLQQLGADAQNKARGEFGADSPITALIIGLTLGLVWVPCAGPALGFALTLVRDEPGMRGLLALGAYAFGTALPLLIVGYGGQAAVHSVRSLTRFTGVIKKVSGVLLILTAFALQFNLFQSLQVWLTDHTPFGDIGTRLEEKYLGDRFAGSPALSVSDMPLLSPPSMNSSSLPRLSRAPELASAGPWHNSQPLTMAGLKGKVVLVDFWTYSCINCIRTLPYIQGYWEKFQSTGKFVLLGVHTPEFTFEKSEKNVAMAIKEHGLTYPIVQDNDFGTWNAFANRYWPAKYLIDAQGYVRYTHFGEGGYEEADRAIASLLGEIGVEANSASPTVPQGVTAKQMEANDASSTDIGGPMSQETYLGSRNWPAFGNAQGEPTSEVLTYPASPLEWGTLILNKYDLVGTWQLIDDEYEQLVSDAGELRMKFQAGEMNAVLGLADGIKPITADVFVDGAKVKTITVDHHDSYAFFKGAYGIHEVVLKIHGKGLQAFSTTFGR